MSQSLLALVTGVGRWESLDWIWVLGPWVIYIACSWRWPTTLLRPFFWFVSRVLYNLRVVGK